MRGGEGRRRGKTGSAAFVVGVHEGVVHMNVLSCVI